MSFGIKISFKSEFGRVVEYHWATTPSYEQIYEFVQEEQFFRHARGIEHLIGFIRDSAYSITCIETESFKVEKI